MLTERQVYIEAANLYYQTIGDVAPLNESQEDASLSDKVRQMIASDRYWEINNYKDFTGVIKRSKKPFYLSPYSEQELEDDDVTTFKLKGFDIGYGLKPVGDGKNVDIIGVHNNEPNVHGVVDSLIQSAIRHGGTQLDHYEGALSKMYSRNGFKEYDRWKFNKKYAHDWSRKRDGKPDVVLRRLDRPYLNEGIITEFFNTLLRLK